MAGESWWKTFLAVVVLLAFLGIGIAHVIKPDYFIRRSGVHKGGELLTEWNRIGFQLVGAIVSAFAICVLWDIFHS